jgi:hypothetical protein
MPRSEDVLCLYLPMDIQEVSTSDAQELERVKGARGESTGLTSSGP